MKRVKRKEGVYNEFDDDLKVDNNTTVEFENEAPHEEEDEYKYVDKNKRIKLLLIFGLIAVVAIIVAIFNGVATKEQKGVTQEETTEVTYTEVTAVDDEFEPETEGETNYSIPPDLSVYGTWDVYGNGAVTLKLKADYTFELNIKADQGTTTYKGNAVVGCGPKALTLSSKNHADVVNTFGLDKTEYNPDNFYVVRCYASTVKENGGEEKSFEEALKDNATDGVDLEEQEGEANCVFNREIYLYNLDDGSLMGTFYDEESVTPLNDMYYVKGEE